MRKRGSQISRGGRKKGRNRSKPSQSVKNKSPVFLYEGFERIAEGTSGEGRKKKKRCVSGKGEPEKAGCISGWTKSSTKSEKDEAKDSRNKRKGKKGKSRNQDLTGDQETRMPHRVARLKQDPKGGGSVRKKKMVTAVQRGVPAAGWGGGEEELPIHGVLSNTKNKKPGGEEKRGEKDNPNQKGGGDEGIHGLSSGNRLCLAQKNKQSKGKGYQKKKTL